MCRKLAGMACWVVGLCLVGLGPSVTTRSLAAGPDNSPALRIEVPVTLQSAKVVFNLDHPVFDGDEPIGLTFLRFMVDRFHADHMQAQIIAIFHGNAGYFGLADATYDSVRNWRHGNPYKDQIAALQRDGVQFEECGETMLLKHWGNADLLPGIKPDTGANYRIIQLVQQGFVQIQP